MISSEHDAASSLSTPIMGPTSPLTMPKTRLPRLPASPASSTSSLPYRRPNAARSSLFLSTSRPASRAASPNEAVRVPGAPAGSIFAGTPSEGAQWPAMVNSTDDLRNLIQQAFVPHIAVHTSADTDELTGEKGFEDGLWQLLRPYGEHIQGKVTIRDSTGANKSCEDYAVRFVQLGNEAEVQSAPNNRRSNDMVSPLVNLYPTDEMSNSRPSRVGGDIEAIELMVDKHLSYAEEFPSEGSGDYLNLKEPNPAVDSVSPFFSLYTKRLLSGIPMAPHETFAHPVACIIAISSRNPSPIEALRRLYDESSRGNRRLPVWVNAEYLRYYVLVHDEEKDDISKSTALFEQMKRHFGLHCHLLRLRSSHCIITDDDAIRFPRSEWISASEELAVLDTHELDDGMDESAQCIYDSDATAIRTFIREMVTQSVIPSMERCVSTWNDQVASRRRGIGARISKLWTGFGGSSRASATAQTGSTYDAVLGFYKADVPEALMRKLADFAFMLRDWKLAQSTYDFCRSDYNNDKAWKYHAAANEMAAISLLMSSQLLSAKMRAETIDQMLETAVYSYLTRCSAPYGALRSLILGMELLRVRGESATDDAARWGGRLLDARLVGPVGDALVKERIAACHASRKGNGSGAWGSRTRKAALWTTLAAHEWIGMRKFSQAEKRMKDVEVLRKSMPQSDSISSFTDANTFTNNIYRALQKYRSSRADRDEQEEDQEVTFGGVVEDEESEAMDTRPHRASLLNSIVLEADVAVLETGDEEKRDDHFE